MRRFLVQSQDRAGKALAAAGGGVAPKGGDGGGGAGGRKPPPGKPRGAARPAPGAEGRTELGDGAWVSYRRGGLGDGAARALFRALAAEVDWRQVQLTVFGRAVDQPRLVSYMADDPDDPRMVLRYSGAALAPERWHPGVLGAKRALEEMSGATFNSCLLNLYRDGGDSCAWHADDEALYGRDPVIGSASLGATREFLLRSNRDRGRKVSFPLGNGDLLVMGGACQHAWMHSVPKRRGVAGARINLTFRRVFPELNRGG